MLLPQFPQCLRLNQRAVAAQHKDIFAQQSLFIHRARLINRVARSLLRRLHDAVARGLVIGERGLHNFRAVANHQHNFFGANLARALHNPLHHGLTSDRVHDLGQVAVHARAFARRQNNRGVW